jgi:hypothetical protein
LTPVHSFPPWGSERSLAAAPEEENAKIILLIHNPVSHPLSLRWESLKPVRINVTTSELKNEYKYYSEMMGISKITHFTDP